MRVVQSALLAVLALTRPGVNAAFAPSKNSYPAAAAARRHVVTAFQQRMSSSTTVTNEETKEAVIGASSLVSSEEKCPSYKELVEKLRNLTQLRRVQAVVNYDQLVFMPQSDRAAAERGAQLSALAGLIHEKATSSEIASLLKTSEEQLLSQASEDVDDETKRILEVTRIDLDKKQRISPELEAKRASLSSSAYAAWVKARQADDFPAFEPVLRDCFDTAMQAARAMQGEEDANKSLYTTMLDEYETGMSADRIDSIFDEIQTALVPLIRRVLESSTPPSKQALSGQTFPIDSQVELNRNIVTALGFDEEHGRIDVSVHPFTTSFGSADVRITSRFSDKEWYQGLAGTIHEGGHAMYEQNLGSSGLEIDEFLSMGTHESQSLFWERHVGLSRPFWNYATPLLQKAFGDQFSFTSEEVYGAVNSVTPSLIRVEADELTYPLHVILRYQLERDVVEGRLDVTDIPQRWKDSMKELLNVDVPNDTNGCLQDVHWSGLAIGYFPTYLIGSATAAQLAHYCRQDIPDFDEQVQGGEFAEIKEWLTSKIHRHGRRYKSLDELLQAQVGEPLNPKYFIQYLTDKYTELYKC
eukprot:scaffold87387_cov63-Attheya_sp.AAC.4